MGTHGGTSSASTATGRLYWDTRSIGYIGAFGTLVPRKAEFGCHRVEASRLTRREAAHGRRKSTTKIREHYRTLHGKMTASKMTKTHKLLIAAWTPEETLNAKLRRMGLETSVRVQLRKGGDYAVTLSLTLMEHEEERSKDPQDDDDEPAGITMKMEITGREPPQADAVDSTWRGMAKSCSTYLSFRTLQKVWD